MVLPQASSGLHIGAEAWYACWRLQARDDMINPLPKPSVLMQIQHHFSLNLATRCDNKALNFISDDGLYLKFQTTDFGGAYISRDAIWPLNQVDTSMSTCRNREGNKQREYEWEIFQLAQESHASLLGCTGGTYGRWLAKSLGSYYS
ncbi:hypothetical protein GX50_03232 [[Emmonsia] crescens]|uniref:Uncharacterized protein n=1 Tax=[Emmonsia] crescens TaxID=73230 RepID=A0A2B7ZKN0_9EURO|nr:hypothetical protein GX50_03232 [Emmonsia crescens]